MSILFSASQVDCFPAIIPGNPKPAKYSAPPAAAPASSIMRLTPGHFSGPHMPIGATGALHASKTGAATPPRYLATLRNYHMAFDRRANGLRFERLRINAGALSVSGQLPGNECHASLRERS
ncbi:hypothetical protein VSR68_31815 [Paraburkholderia phymatum]|uniref:hypothetical protein n=1 Tax=Paraburkholderia phymatum TaxID=148447 RepID=UPI0031727D8C